MQNQHKILLSKEEFDEYSKAGVFRMEAVFFVGDELVRSFEAKLVYEVANKGNNVEITFSGVERKTKH